MSTLNRETVLVQNPALGAMLLWRFIAGFSTGSKTSQPTPLPLLFLVLPICLHDPTAKLAESTQTGSGLRAFAGKFSASNNSKGDLLLAIHERALRMRGLTLTSLRLAVGSKLVLLVPEQGVALAGTMTPPRAGVPTPIRKMTRVAEKLGGWCSVISLHEVSSVLRVRF